MKLIDVKQLVFEYFRRDDEGNVTELVRALDKVSLDIKSGEFVVILGKNGSGKSTLAKHLNALLLPESGEVIVDNMNIEDEELRLEIRKTAGMVFQNPDNQIVANLVEEDVAFGPENLGMSTKTIWERVKKSLEQTGMYKYSKQSPNHLSGGQKQRVAIAGVLAMQPKCIIFDEATAMLDPAGRKKVLNIIMDLKNQGITIILITHHMDEAIDADKVILMNQGRLEQVGKPEEIFSNVDLLEKCGLSLPAFYEYMNFMLGQGLLEVDECKSVKSAEDLDKCIANKFGYSYGVYKNNEIQNMNLDNSVRILEQTEVGVKGILLNQVSYAYNRGYANEYNALKNVDLFIGKGEFVAIIGHTGSGKSTLMQHLNGLNMPMKGKMYFDGRDVSEKDYPIKELRQKVGLVFQYPEYQLFAETVEKDVCFGPENMNISRVEAQKRAYEAIRAVGLPDTIYDYSPLQLSGGQKRRVAIAGVLAMQPEYLVLDEPTAGLDPGSAFELLEMLKHLQTEQGISVVMVSHDMEQVVEYADRIIVMDNGQKVLDGTPDEVFSRREYLEKLGLEVPLGVKILHGLKKVCKNIDAHVYRKIDVFGELIKLKKSDND